MFWFQQGLCSLPVSLVVLSSCTFIFSYIFAVLRHDVEVLLPYISDTANTPPESCFFGFMTFLSACAGIGTIYAMYKYTEKLSQHRVSTSCNKAALGLGLLSICGMCVVATFQESLKVVHYTGALLFFLCGALYITMETYISYRTCPYGSSLFVCRTRLIINIIYVGVFLFTLISKLIEKDPRFQMIWAASEWIVAFSYISFFLTYIHDFKKFTLHVKTVCGTGTYQ